MAIESRLSAFARRFSRKPPDAVDIVRTSKSGGDMARCLTTLDLISLGLGSITGANLYIIPNRIASLAGGAGVISLALTTLVSLTTGLHYAELATALPNTSGSIYMYVYFTLGEVMAVVAAWSLLAEYLVGGCFALIGFSSVVNSMSDGYIQEYGRMATDSAGLPPIDFVAALVCILLTWIIASGVEMSVGFVKVMNVITMVVLVFFFTVALWLGTEENWEEKGFVPYGVDGIIATIPMSYYAIVGFDSLATAGDECKTPNKSIPIALFATIIVGGFLLTALPVFFITYVVPLGSIPDENGILDVFAPLGYPYVKYIMGVGAITSLLTTIFGGLYPTTRVAYAIAKESFICRYFEKICPKRHTPFRATIICGTVATLMAAFLDLSILLGFGVLAALVCYVFVVAATLMTRYQDRELYRTLKSAPAPNETTRMRRRKMSRTYSTFTTFGDPILEGDEETGSRCVWIRSKFRQIQMLSFSYFKTFLTILHLCIILCCVLVAVYHNDLNAIPIVAMVFFGISAVCILFMFGILVGLPQLPGQKDSFRSPMIPYISLITTTINIYFMTLFDLTAWLFYIGWIGFGLLIYIMYGFFLTCRPPHETPEEPVEKDDERTPILPADGGEEEEAIDEGMERAIEEGMEREEDVIEEGEEREGDVIEEGEEREGDVIGEGEEGKEEKEEAIEEEKEGVGEQETKN